MQIEAQRGWSPSCYACLIVDETTSPNNSGIAAVLNDYRNLAGLMGQTGTIGMMTISKGLGPGPQRSTLELFEYDDYVLRATGFGWAGPHANAEQLLKAYAVIIDELWKPGGRYLGPSHIGVVVFSWGGYSSTPSTANPADQILTMTYGLLAAETTIPDLIMATFESHVDQWYSILMTSSPPYPSLADYMQQQPYWQTYRS